MLIVFSCSWNRVIIVWFLGVNTAFLCVGDKFYGNGWKVARIGVYCVVACGVLCVLDYVCVDAVGVNRGVVYKSKIWL